MQESTRHPMLEYLDPLVGRWETESVHRLLPDTILQGQASFEWIEGGHFLIWRGSVDHPAFPASLAILGCTAAPITGDSNPSGQGCFVHSYDSRGKFRPYELTAEPGRFQYTGDLPEFSQRFTATFSSDPNTFTGLAELSHDGITWEHDLKATYRRLG